MSTLESGYCTPLTPRQRRQYDWQDCQRRLIEEMSGLVEKAKRDKCTPEAIQLLEMALEFQKKARFEDVG